MYKFHVIITSWTKYFFSGRGERPNGKHLHCKTCFSFSSKGWTNSFLTWPLHVLLSSLRRQPTFRDSTSGCPAKRRLFSPAIFHIAEFICACFFFPRGIYRFHDGGTQMNTIQESLQNSLRLVESDNRLIFCQKNKHNACEPVSFDR